MDFVFKIPPQEYTLTAYIVATIIADGLTLDEQNTIGNFFELVGATIIASAGQQELQDNEKNISIKG